MKHKPPLTELKLDDHWELNQGQIVYFGLLDVGNAHSDAINDGCPFTLGRLWVPNQVVPRTEDTPAESEILVGGAG